MDIETILKALDDLLNQERDSPGSMAIGHGRALVEAIKLLEALADVPKANRRRLLVDNLADYFSESRHEH
jgi:hypothetical protein